MPERDSRATYYATILEGLRLHWHQSADPALDSISRVVRAMLGPPDIMPILKTMTPSELKAMADAVRPHLPVKTRGPKPKVPTDSECKLWFEVQLLMRRRGWRARTACGYLAKKSGVKLETLHKRYQRTAA